MSSLLRRASLARVAVSTFSTTPVRYFSYPCPLPPIFGSCSLAAYDTAAGHLGIARAHRGLGELNSLLTPEALFLDATHVLASGALGHKPFSGEMTRHIRDDVRGIIAKDWSGKKAAEVQELRLRLALVDAEDGRFVDALNALDHLAAERPSDPRPRICASVICCFVGLPEEGKEFLVSIPEDILQEYRVYRKRAVMAATLGGAPCAIAGLEDLVASMAFESINSALEAKYLDGDISLFKKVAFSALLRCVVADKLIGQVAGEASPPRCDRKEPLFPVLRGACVDASRALLSAVLLRASPLSGKRIHDARRAVERDLARAVEEGDGPAAADQRLLLALFAARDGRFDDALQLYEVVAGGDPRDPRPHALAHMLCGVVGRRKEFSRWNANFQLRVDSGFITAELRALQDEVVVAAALGGALQENAGDEGMPSLVKRATRLFVFCAWRRVDAGLGAALLRDKMSIVKRMQVRAARAFLSAWTRSVLKGMNAKVLEKEEEEHKQEEV